MSFLDQLTLALGLICALLMIRNAVTFHITMKALNIAHELSERDFNAGVYGKWEGYYAAIESPTYNQIVLDLTKWTVRGTYPALFKQLEAA